MLDRCDGNWEVYRGSGRCDRCWTGVMVIGKCTGDRGSVTVASMLRSYLGVIIVFRNCEFKKINVSLSFFQQAFTRISYKSKKFKKF